MKNGTSLAKSGDGRKAKNLRNLFDAEGTEDTEEKKGIMEHGNIGKAECCRFYPAKALWF
jgi:hypothetical protein